MSKRIVRVTVEVDEEALEERMQEHGMEPEECIDEMLGDAFYFGHDGMKVTKVDVAPVLTLRELQAMRRVLLADIEREEAFRELNEVVAEDVTPVLKDAVLYRHHTVAEANDVETLELRLASIGIDVSEEQENGTQS
jgi:hypothetical protein